MPRPNRNNGQNIAQPEPFDPFFGNTNRRMVIIFITGTGMKVPMNVPIDVSAENVFIAFIQKMNLDKSVLGKFIYFLNNGRKISTKEKRNIVELGLRDSDVFIVIDTSNLLGA